MSLSRRVGRNAAGQLSGRLVTSALAFVITALLLPRQLGEADFGVFAFYLTLYQLLNNVLDFGAGTIVVREASRDRAAAGRLIGMLIRLKARFAAVGFVVLVAVAFAFEGAGSRTGLLVIAALHLLFHAPAGAAAIFAVDMAFARSVLAGVAGQVVWLAATGVLVAADVTRPAPYLIAFGAGPVVNGVLAYVWARQRVHIRFDADADERRRLWRAAWPAGVSMTMAAVYFYIDTIMLRPLVGEVGVAHYSAAYRLMAFALMVPVLFSQVIFPVFSRLWARGASVLDPFFQRSTVVLVSLGLLFSATVPWVAGAVMDAVYPPEYVAGARCLAILSLAIVFVFAAYPHVLALLAADRQRVMMTISIGGAVLNVVLNLTLVPAIGIEGAAWATVATEGFVVAAAALAAWRLTGLHFRPLALARAAACATLACVSLALLLPRWEGSAERLVLGLVIGALGVAAAGVLPLELGTDEGAPPA